jgi:hypothetical protein
MEHTHRCDRCGDTADAGDKILPPGWTSRAFGALGGTVANVTEFYCDVCSGVTVTPAPGRGM